MRQRSVPTVSGIVPIVRYLHSLRAPLRCLCSNQEKLNLAMNMVYFIISVPGQLAINSECKESMAVDVRALKPVCVSDLD